MTCRDCGKLLGERNRTGFCRRHVIAHILTDPEIERRRLDGVRRDAVNNHERKRATMLRVVSTRKTDRRVAWCPPRYRGEYYNLKINKGLSASEARRIIAEQIERDFGGVTDPLARAILERGLAA